jgi:hypothetical protein
MKKSIFQKAILALAILALSGNLTAQMESKVELTPFGGYLLGGSIEFYEGKFKIEDAACYGVNLAVRVRSGNFIELGWTGMNTEGNWEPDFQYSGDHPAQNVDMAVHHFQVGSLNEFQLNNDAVRPYATGSMGATWFNLIEDGATDEWLFSVMAGLGLKYFFTEKIGIRIQARLILPIVWDGGGFYIGSSSSGMYVSSTAPVVQGDFTGGLIIALGD